MSLRAPQAPDAAARLIAVNRRRRAVRRWVAIGSLPVVLAALLLVVKLLSMVGFAHQAITAHLAGDAEGTVAAASGQQPANWFEPYKAPYNLGVGLASAGRLEESRAAFEEALGLATGLEVCAIRVNLALVIEWMGDAAQADGDGVAARELFGEALQLVLDTPEECRSDEADEQSPDPERDLDDTLDEQEQRLRDKIQPEASGQGGEGEGESSDSGQGPSQSDLDEIGDRLDQGQQERDDLGGGGGGSGTERPW